MSSAYTPHEGKVVEAGARFKHVMALALDPRDRRHGLIRCITSREGDVAVMGFIDRSELHTVNGSDLETFRIGKAISVKNQAEIVKKIIAPDQDFIGLEDPDIWIDEKSGLRHIFVTLPLINLADELKTKIHLGHIVGKDFDSLEMVEPALMADKTGGAKESSIAPVNSRGFRYNLVESSVFEEGTYYSVVRAAIARDMAKPWEFGEVLFHPKERGAPWIGGHASPGPLFSKDFIDLGPGKCLGVINGREANTKAGGRTLYGIFSVGLFIYDYENGKIDWVSPEPFIRDSEARTITFASQLVETGKGQGILYAHVDDSFVRAYSLDAEKIKTLLPRA